MPSSYSTDLKIELMVTGENAGTWGNKTNDNLNVVQQAIVGFDSINIAGGAQTTTLVIDNSPTLSPARSMVLKLTGTITGNQIVTVPTGIEKTYIVQNGTTGAFTVEFKQAGGTGSIFSTTDKGIKILFADGTNINAVDLDTFCGTIATAQLEGLSVTSAKLASFAVTEARLASFAITTAKLDTGAVTELKITQSTITQSKLAANSVGSSQLIATAVTPNTYTAASITVDADGRITAASSGGTSAGKAMEIPTLAQLGPASGTFTANPVATRLGVYMYSGGGGAGGSGRNMEGGVDGGGSGASGAFGFYNSPIVGPFSQPYSIGGGGTGGNLRPNNYQGNPGNAGGGTTIANVGTVNGGNGGNGAPGLGTGGNPGNPGNTPGASLVPGWRQFVQGTNIGSGESASGALIVFENIGT